MKRKVFDVLRRGADNTLANWQLILLRVGEMVLFGILTVVTIVAALAPILISLGIEFSKLRSPDDLEQAAMALAGRWMLLVWVLVAISVLMLVLVMVHAFVEAGSARIYVHAERAAGPVVAGPRGRYRLFSMDRWMAGARDGWWTLFWIYNIAWGVAGLILLIPLLPTLVAMILLREQPPALVVTGCIGLFFTGLLLIVVGAATGMWVNRAVNEWAVQGLDARAALAASREAIRVDFGRHLLIFIAVVVVGMAGSSFFASFSFFAAIGDVMGHDNPGMSFAMVPLRLIGSLLNSIFSSVVSAWYLATYGALATERSSS